MTISVVLAEDNYLVREGIFGLLDAHPDVDVVASCGDLDSLFAAVERETPDVVLTDIRMPPTGTDEGIQAANRFRDTSPDMGVVVLSQHDEAEYALALLEHGSEGRAYLLKERVSDSTQLIGAIREVSDGGSVIDPKVVEALVAARSRASESPLAALTPRETEILGEMAQGKTNAAIAAALFLTERAVEKHINSIFPKLGLSGGEREVHRRVKAVLLFLSETE
jgi:DNA-binding NarL/FixJ family response regulator